MAALLEILIAELERPREVTAQVVNHLIGTYGLNRDELGSFLLNELPKLEDYEVDLILSPLFTPSLKDQAAVVVILGRESIPAAGWAELVQQLVTRPTCARLVTEDAARHIVPLREVTIERWVHRLRLDAEIPEPLFKLIAHLMPATDHALLLAIARRAIWENAARRDILSRYLTVATNHGTYQSNDAAELLKLAETYQPADVAELLARIPHWQQVLRQEINDAGGAKPFFNERVEDLHGGGRDQRRQDNRRLIVLQNESQFLERIARVLSG